jgi:adenylylsulfate kinase
VEAGTLVLTAFISPFQRERNLARQLVEKGEFIEVFIDTPLTVCEQRDPKGLYQQARNGQIASFTGISSAYERPEKPELTIYGENLSIDECANQVVSYLKQNGYL